ncbi:MAG: ABC-F family ATP-binding cassette domain-containing protein [Candidatus Cloacimonetes bacterium]|nr:ABC-F family ATP-binding cassette domain-containing protein [Candidatus Cloacimonadota bacterium]
MEYTRGAMAENLVSVENLAKQMAGKTLFTASSFGIERGDKIGLLGVNGCGKSTFLRILAGEETPDDGRVTLRGGVRLHWLPQQPRLDEKLTIIEQVYAGDSEDFRLLRRYHQITARLEYDISLADEHQKLLATLSARDSWQAEVRARSILSRLGHTDLDRVIGTLSGGEKRRLDLARVLQDSPDILLLDEPTNHLDIETIEWLQDTIAAYNGTVVFVTHDRYFLDVAVTRIMEIDGGPLRFFESNYSSYLRQKELQLIDTERKETRRRAQLQKELKWLSRGAKARTSKPKDHVARVKQLIDKSYMDPTREMEISFQSHRLGKTILEMNAVSKAYDKPLFTDFTHTFQARERIGIVGPNGCGKTTLVRLMTGIESPDDGKVKVGVNTRFAWFRQETSDFERADMTVLDYIREQADNVRTADGELHDAAVMLERFLFTRREQRSKLCSLSGGERKRLFLLKSLIFGSNFLILDEPTNDLDIRTLEVLEDYLDAYRGCLVVVSHDRYFLDRIVDMLWVFEEDGIRKFPGNYADWLLVRRWREAERAGGGNQKPAIARRERGARLGLSYHEVRKLAETEKMIDELDEQKKKLNTLLETKSHTLTPDDFRRLSAELTALDLRLDEMMNMWESLESKRLAGESSNTSKKEGL